MVGTIDFDRVLGNLAGRSLIGFKETTQSCAGAVQAIDDKEYQVAEGSPALRKSTTAKRGVKP